MEQKLKPRMCKENADWGPLTLVLTSAPPPPYLHTVAARPKKAPWFGHIARHSRKTWNLSLNHKSSCLSDGDGDWGRVSCELTQDRRACGAAVRGVNSIGDDGSTLPQVNDATSLSK